MDDETFLNLRLGMEEYQMHKYPELRHSIVYTGREKTKERAKNRDQNTRNERQYQRSRRTNSTTEKEQLREQVSKALDAATSKADFFSALENQGLHLYTYRGKITGVRGAKRKYRFTTLGITKQQLLSLDRLAERYKDFDSLTTERDDFELEL